MELEWNIFPGYNTLQLDEEIKSLLLRLMRHQRISQEVSHLCRCSTTFLVSQMTMNKNAWRMPNSFLCMQRDLEKEKCSFIGLGSEKKWFCISDDSPQRVWDNMAERKFLEFAESMCPFFRVASPLSRGRLKSKGHGKLSIHYAADLETFRTVFRRIVSANQLSLYGAIAETCEECEILHERTGRPVVMGQSSSSLVLSLIETEVLLDCDDRANKDLLLLQHGERIEKLSQQDKLSKFCMSTGFPNVVEIGQYYMTKDTAEFSQFHAVACREYFQEKKQHHNQKNGSEGTPKLGPYWKLQPVICTVSMELRSEFGP